LKGTEYNARGLARYRTSDETDEIGNPQRMKPEEMDWFVVGHGFHVAVRSAESANGLGSNVCSVGQRIPIGPGRN
jgi:hypothetical protein